MPINPPVSHTVISTAQWGIPITNQVNANTTDIAAMKPTAWTAFTFQNGWQNWGGGFVTAAYRKVGDMVQLRGMIKNGATLPSPGESICATLPVGYRPPAPVIFAVVFGGTDSWGGPGRMDVMNSGDIKVTSAAALPGATSMVAFACQFSIIA